MRTFLWKTQFTRGQHAKPAQHGGIGHLYCCWFPVHPQASHCYGSSWVCIYSALQLEYALGLFLETMAQTGTHSCLWAEASQHGCLKCSSVKIVTWTRAILSPLSCLTAWVKKHNGFFSQSGALAPRPCPFHTSRGRRKLPAAAASALPLQKSPGKDVSPANLGSAQLADTTLRMYMYWWALLTAEC